MRSLRGRLLTAVAAVIVAAVAAVGLVARGTTRVEFTRFLEEERTRPAIDTAALTDLAAAASKALADGGWSAVERLLAGWQHGSPGGPRALVLGPDDTLLAAGDPTLHGFRFSTTAEGELRLERGESDLSEQFALRLPSAPVRDHGGNSAGRLLLVPLPSGQRAPPETLFLVSTRRWLLAAVVAAGLLALAVAAIATRRILAPLDQLTNAARELGSGDLERRVRIRGEDEVARLGRAFNAMAEAVQRNETLRRNLISDTAHELRTPVTNLRCQIEALQDGLLEPSAETVASLGEEITQLQRLVDDLQELALADAGHLRLELERVELQTEAERVASGLAAAREGAPIGVRLGALPPVHADPRRVRQILANLLRNALDHTPADGSVEVRGEAGPEEVEITVRDTGPGVPREHLPHLFERFYRTDPSRQRGTGGAGLGLAIVRHLVEAHGGRVRAESPPGGGALFAFTLPRWTGGVQPPGTLPRSPGSV